MKSLNPANAIKKCEIMYCDKELKLQVLQLSDEGGVIDEDFWHNDLMWEPDLYTRPEEYNKLSDTLEFEVVSANGQNSQKYKITVYQHGHIENCTVSGIKDKTYSGAEIKQNLTVKEGDVKLTEGKDYKVEYLNNTGIGTATVTITGIGEFSGTVSKNFEIMNGGTAAEGDIFADSNMVRYYGSTRFETSLDTARALKASMNVDKFDAVVVANGMNFPDALSGTYLAKVKNAPVLIVDPEDKDNEDTVMTYIKRNLVDGGDIYLLGGKAVVSERFENGLKNNFKVKRLWGNNRYETNIEILKECGVTNEDLLVCSGNGFADSLSASAAGKPILLVDNSLLPMQRSYLDGLSTNKMYIVGGTGAVSSNVEGKLKAFANIKRLSGKNRFETSTMVADEFFQSGCDNIVLAYGYNFPDGLSAGPLALSVNAPLILVSNTDYADARAWVSTSGAKNVAIIGGSGLISDTVAKRIINLN